MNTLIDPRTVDLRLWADSVVFDLEQFGPIGRLENETEWQDWGAGLIGINGISQRNPPSPYQYDDWKEWAIRFYQMFD
jgi:hypothetical protein